MSHSGGYHQKVPSKVTICGSVDSESLQFLEKALRLAGYSTRRLFLLSQSRYRQGHLSGGLSRIILRACLYIGFPLKLLIFALAARKGSVFIVTTNPFFAPLLVTFVSRQRCKVIQLLYDLFPDALEAASDLPKPRFILSLIGKITSATQKRVGGTVYLGTFLQNHTERRWGSAKSSAVISVGCDESLFTDFSNVGPQDSSPSRPLSIHIGGQMGHMHAVVPTLNAFEHAFSVEPSLTKSFRFDCFVSGPLTSVLRSYADRLPLSVSPPAQNWPSVVAQSQLGLVSLSPSGSSVCLPSRTYSVMAAGLAVIAVCPPWSDLAKLVTENDIGWVIRNSEHTSETLEGSGNYQSALERFRNPKEIGGEIAHLLLRLQSAPEELRLKQQNARRVALDRYSTLPIADLWKRYITRIEMPPES